jgi:hypothetical protein
VTPLDAYAALDEYAMEYDSDLDATASLQKASWAWLLPVLRSVGPMLMRNAPKIMGEVAKGVGSYEVTKHMQPQKPDEPNEATPPPETGQRRVDRRSDASQPLSYGASVEAAVEAAEDGAEALLHDEPEPALPSTDGENEHTGSIEDIVASFQATAGARGLMSGGQASSDIAAAAKEHLAKTALRDFSPAERAAMISEGQGGPGASNLDRLDITGTHYEAIDAMRADEDDEEWMS